MSAELNGKLRNTREDILIDTALLILTICAYIPQISQIRKSTSTSGISPYYILFNIFFSNAQLSQLLLWAAYAWPDSSSPVLKRINEGSLKGLAALGGVLGFLQVFVQWSCSVIILVMLVVNTPAASSQGRNIAITAFIHTAAVVFPAVAFTLPKPPEDNFLNSICIALIDMSNRVVAPCFVLLQFYAQLKERRARNGQPGALSLLSIGLQAPTILTMAFRWSLRIGHPTWTGGPAPPWLWYEWGYPAINYLIHAIGCAILLLCYMVAARSTAAEDSLGDRAPLLG